MVGQQGISEPVRPALRSPDKLGILGDMNSAKGQSEVSKMHCAYMSIALTFESLERLYKVTG